MAEQSTVDLVAVVVTREATKARGDAALPYSWGTTLRLAPGHARGTAVAVVDALRRAGRLVTAERLAEVGRHGWAYGWMVGAVIGGLGERHDWPWLVSFGAGAASFAAGVWVIGWAARRMAGRAGD